MLNNHLAIADQLFSRRSFTEHVLTRLLCNSTQIAPEHKTLVRATALGLIECGAAFLVTGNRRMGEIAMDRHELLSRLSPAMARLADILATLFAAACVLDREQGQVCWKACKRLMSRMMRGAYIGSMIGELRQVCWQMRDENQPRLVRWAA